MVTNFLNEVSTGRGASSISIRILERLWTWVVQPILERLHLIKPASESQTLPHITWCPTGPLLQLPLHAAGIYDASKQHRPRVYDYVVSSYTPSLSALQQRGRQAPSTLSSQPSLLMVAQPATPNFSPLPGTREECARIRAVLSGATCTLIEHEQAVVADTHAIIGQYPWVHLACHGKQDTTDPTQSAFALYDGPLTLSALMNTVADNAELAFLSACQTAVGDEKVPEESAHLAAGDQDAPIVAEAYYKKSVELRSSGMIKAGTGAAYALHEAVKVLREGVGEQNIIKWAPFVHFGV
ncbi:unnamed protein product [Peniophora sp. CBMAI 1063]|nr:unnamed protein product [Peniophora sp. CBMAI 1063]